MPSDPRELKRLGNDFIAHSSQVSRLADKIAAEWEFLGPGLKEHQSEPWVYYTMNETRKALENAYLKLGTVFVDLDRTLKAPAGRTVVERKLDASSDAHKAGEESARRMLKDRRLRADIIRRVEDGSFTEYSDRMGASFADQTGRDAKWGDSFSKGFFDEVTRELKVQWPGAAPTIKAPSTTSGPRVIRVGSEPRHLGTFDSTDGLRFAEVTVENAPGIEGTTQKVVAIDIFPTDNGEAVNEPEDHENFELSTQGILEANSYLSDHFIPVRLE